MYVIGAVDGNTNVMRYTTLEIWEHKKCKKKQF